MTLLPLLLFCAATLPVLGETWHHSSFDGSLKVRPEGAWKGKAHEFVPGVAGQAIHIKGTGQMILRGAAGFNGKEGTLSFWVKTDWAGNDDQKHDILGLGTASGIRVLKDATNGLHFVWHPGNGQNHFVVSLDITKNWPAGDWRHLAFTWKNGSYAVYVDGVLKQRETPETPPAPISAVDALALGTITGGTAGLAVDELTFHDVELYRNEVREVFVAGIERLEKHGDPRLVMRALINQKPATLIMDTGATLNCLFRDFALEAGVQAKPSYRGGVLFQEEADATITLENGPAFKQRFAVLKNVARFRQHGIVGWAQFFEANRLRILWEERTMQPLSQESMEEMIEGWTAHSYSAGKGSLKLPKVSIRIDDVELHLPMVVDTGMSGGLTLSAKTWASVLPRLSSPKRSLNSAWTPAQGAQTFMTTQPQSIEMLGTRMQGISISEDRHQKDSDAEERASIGLAALSFFDVVIDGKRGTLWLRPRPAPAIHENVNYSGLLIYDADNEARNKIEVLEETPAWHLGLRSRDAILAVDGRKFDSDNVDELIALKDRIDAGTPVRIKLQRGPTQLEVGGAPPKSP